MTEPSAVKGGNNESLMPPRRAGYAGESDREFWYSLITEKDAAAFLKLTDRTMQAYRQKGGGPQYIRLSSRCLRYRRIDLCSWAEARMRTSTSDQGQG
jgi:hypothetical protein